MKEEEKMPIDLVDGWQNQRLAAKVYPLGMKDKEFLNATHDEFHCQGKRSWMKQPTPFACPAFVAWHVVNEQKKGRVVIDLRQLNRIALYDTYKINEQSLYLSISES
jgi:hypothetical protein